MKRRIIAIKMAFCLLVPAYAFAESTLKDKYSDAELIQIFKDEGYSAVSKKEDGIIRIKIDGEIYVIYNKYGGDLQNYYGISNAKISYEDINEWNRTKRLSRAYLDSDQDSILESDLLANGGLTNKNVTEFFKIFVASGKAFKEFLTAHKKN